MTAWETSTKPWPLCYTTLSTWFGWFFVFFSLQLEYLCIIMKIFFLFKPWAALFFIFLSLLLEEIGFHIFLTPFQTQHFSLFNLCYWKKNYLNSYPFPIPIDWSCCSHPCWVERLELEFELELEFKQIYPQYVNYLR